MEGNKLDNVRLIGGMISVYRSIFSDAFFEAKIEEGITKDSLKRELLTFYHGEIFTRPKIDIEEVCRSVVIEFLKWDQYMNKTLFKELSLALDKELDKLIADYRVLHPVIIEPKNEH